MLVNDGRALIITGASKGLGRELVDYFLKKSIVVIGISRGRCDIIHENYFHFQLDISKEIEVKTLFRDLKKSFSNIQCLINNAAISYSNNVLLTSAEEAKKVFDSNFIGSFLMTKETIKYMKKLNSGRIISVSSILSKKFVSGSSMYSASKAALENFLQVLRREVKEYNISIDLVRLSAIYNIGMSNKLTEEAKKEIINISDSKKMINLQDTILKIDNLIHSDDLNLEIDIQ